LDVVLAGPGLEEDFQDRAVPVDIEGVLVPVITAEDLIITKVLAGRAKDIEDIRSVIHEHRTSLDIERIRTILRLLEQALGQSDLLPAFEKQWEK
jgi:predicted nucleotidyltransferase